MKKISTLLAITLFFFSCENDLNGLKNDRKKLISSHKENIKNYTKELNRLDSLINVHPQSTDAVVEIKTVPVTVTKVSQKIFEHF